MDAAGREGNLPRDGRAVERGEMRKAFLIAIAALVSACTRDAVTTRGDTSSSQPRAAATRSPMSIFNRDVRAPEGVRIRVEVLNATKTRGLGRRAMMFLRDRGFDVVELGTADSLRDSTLVLDRSSHPD